MGRHVIWTFTGVHVRPVFRCEAIEGHGQVSADVRVGVFLQRERRRGVTNKDVQQASLAASNLRERMQHVRGDQVKTSREGRELEFFL